MADNPIVEFRRAETHYGFIRKGAQKGARARGLSEAIKNAYEFRLTNNNKQTDPQEQEVSIPIVRVWQSQILGDFENI